MALPMAEPARRQCVPFRRGRACAAPRTPVEAEAMTMRIAGVMVAVILAVALVAAVAVIVDVLDLEHHPIGILAVVAAAAAAIAFVVRRWRQRARNDRG
jgi:Flp pilus assembly protein TadB